MGLKQTLLGGSEVKKMDVMTKGQKRLLAQSAQLGQQYQPMAYQALGQIAGQSLTEDIWQTRYRQPMMRQFEMLQRDTRQQLAGRSGFHNAALMNTEMDNIINREMQMMGLRGSVEQSYDARRMQAAMGIGGLAGNTLGQRAYEPLVTSEGGLFGTLAQIGVTAAAGKSMFK